VRTAKRDLAVANAIRLKLSYE
jgi:predicted dithiol-disulfide oxidoreductase (DUF899 family)